MKRKEVSGGSGQDTPPMHTFLQFVVKKTEEKRIRSMDYQAWEKYDVDKACEEIDMAEVFPVPLQNVIIHQVTQEKFREDAQIEKEKGNAFVRQEKLDEAIQCYNRALELVKDNPILFANRGLCYLKKGNLRQADRDCTDALSLDPTYVKALHRRATARERLGSLRAAIHDLMEVLQLEPHNTRASLQLEAIRTRMYTKCSISKSLPSTSACTDEQLPIEETSDSPGPVHQIPEAELEKMLEKWNDDGVTLIQPIYKPLHQRSTRPLKSITIKEIPLGQILPEEPSTSHTAAKIEQKPAQIDDQMPIEEKKAGRGKKRLLG